MKGKLAALGAVLLIASAFADDSGGRAKVNGEWQLQTGAGKDAGETWILAGREDALHITQLQNGQKLAEFDCNTKGRECEAKDAGRHAKVSFWFNGPKLVELETRGSEVVKRRFSVGDKGDVMEVEVIPIVPAGKPEVLQFKRMQVATAQK
jgi:hypothetical protein